MPLRALRTRCASALALALALAPALAVGCAAAPPPPKPLPAVTAAPLPPAPEPAQLEPARWLRGGGATVIGPRVAGGTLVLLGGRRALVGDDGKVTQETAHAPEALYELVRVPTKTGGAVVVGRGTFGVYRFDDPLGPAKPLVRARSSIAQLGAGPGVLAIWSHRVDRPALVDVETGAPASLPSAPELPMLSLAFVDVRRGAAVFAGAGLAVTTDGGATYRLARGENDLDPLRVQKVSADGDVVRATYPTGDEQVDLAAATLVAGRGAVAPDAPALLRWIDATGRDPVEAAIASGVGMLGGGGLVASDGLLARLDPRGAIVGLTEFAKGASEACGIGRALDAAWIGCPVPPDDEDDLYDPFVVARVPLASEVMNVDKPAVRRNGTADIRTSPSGGVLLAAPCSSDEPGIACVRQPDGKWITIPGDPDGLEGLGPLADGRVVVLRGLGTRSDEAPDDASANPGLHVDVVDASGHARPFAPPGFGRELTGDLAPTGWLEEQEDHTLRIVIRDDRGPHVVVQPPDHEAAPAPLVPDATMAWVHGGRGFAIGKAFSQSLDGGATWAPVAAPAELAARAKEDAGYEPGTVVVGDLGVQLDDALRFGWGPGAQPDAPAPDLDDQTPEIIESPHKSAGKDQVLTCTRAGASAATAPFDALPEAVLALAPSGKPPRGTRRASSGGRSGSSGPAEVYGVLTEEGPSGAPGPSTWRFAVLDPAEIGGKPHVVSGPAPKGIAWGARVTRVLARHGRALFVLRSSDASYLVRVDGARFESVAAPADLLPTSSDAGFGAARGEPIAWVHDGSVVAWTSGDGPRVVALVASRTGRLLGDPTKDGVPLLLHGDGWSALRTIPLPPPPARGQAPAAAPPVAAELAGWSAGPDLASLPELPACGPHAKGTRFRLAHAPKPATWIDGAEAPLDAVEVDFAVEGASACIDALTARLWNPRRPAPPRAAPSAKTPSPSVPARFLRVDARAGRAEARDDDHAGAMHAARCTLAPK